LLPEVGRHGLAQGNADGDLGHVDVARDWWYSA